MKSKIQAWLMASRPKTLPAAFTPIIVASSMAWYYNAFKITSALACLIGILLLQIAVNFANDYFDFIKGIDNEERLGPIRATSSGLISLKHMKLAIIVCLLLLVLDGIYLIYISGLPILIIGALSIISLLAYSGGPFPLASHGWGDFFVFLFFGFVAICTTFYIQTNHLTVSILIASIPPAMQSTAILVVNNFRDRDSDKKTGKRTLAVRLGIKGSRVEYIALIIIPYFIPLIFYIFWINSPLMALPLITLPYAIKLIKEMMGRYKGRELNKTLAGTAKLLLWFNSLFSFAIILSQLLL